MEGSHNRRRVSERRRGRGRRLPFVPRIFLFSINLRPSVMQCSARCAVKAKDPTSDPLMKEYTRNLKTCAAPGLLSRSERNL